MSDKSEPRPSCQSSATFYNRQGAVNWSVLSIATMNTKDGIEFPFCESFQSSWKDIYFYWLMDSFVNFKELGTIFKMKY